MSPADASNPKARDGSVKPGNAKAHEPFTPADARTVATKALNQALDDRR